jgi:hypothetical protein
MTEGNGLDSVAVPLACLFFITLFLVGFIIVGIPIPKYETYNVVVNSKYVNTSCGVYCALTPIINTTNGDFVATDQIYAKMNVSSQYTIKTEEPLITGFACVHYGGCRFIIGCERI